MKKLLLTLIMGLFVILPLTVKADEEVKANVYLFHGDGCPHCEEAIAYFNSISDEYSFNLIAYEVWYNENNSAIMQQIATKLNVDASGVPFIVIGKQAFSGYAESYNEDIIAAIEAEVKSNNKNDVVASYNAEQSDINVSDEQEEKKSGKGAILIFVVLVVGGLIALVICGKKSVEENLAN